MYFLDCCLNLSLLFLPHFLSWVYLFEFTSFSSLFLFLHLLSRVGVDSLLEAPTILCICRREYINWKTPTVDRHKHTLAAVLFVHSSCIVSVFPTCVHWIMCLLNLCSYLQDNILLNYMLVKSFPSNCSLFIYFLILSRVLIKCMPFFNVKAFEFAPNPDMFQ